MTERDEELARRRALNRPKVLARYTDYELLVVARAALHCYARNPPGRERDDCFDRWQAVEGERDRRDKIRAQAHN